MVLVDFIYNGNIIGIQCNKNETMRNILYKFTSKVNTNINSIYLIYSGKIISNQNMTFDQIANYDDRLRNKMNVLIQDQMKSSLISQDQTLNTQKYQIIPSYNIVSPNQIVPGYNQNIPSKIITGTYNLNQPINNIKNVPIIKTGINPDYNHQANIQNNIKQIYGPIYEI